MGSFYRRYWQFLLVFFALITIGGAFSESFFLDMPTRIASFIMGIVCIGAIFLIRRRLNPKETE